MVGIKMATLEELLKKENEAKVLEKERKKRSKAAKTEDKEDSKLEHFEEENPEEVTPNSIFTNLKLMKSISNFIKITLSSVLDSSPILNGKETRLLKLGSACQMNIVA